jgi:type II secretory pathway pseudopilin PulG
VISKQYGFGLIEVLIACLVLGIGMAALVKLENLYSQASRLSKARNIAMNLAQQKLDDLKGFSQLTADANQFTYSDIETNHGGALKADGLLKFPAGLVTGYADSYQLTWTVENGYWYQQHLTYTPPSPLPAYPDQKRITVNLDWADQHLQLQTIIAAISPNLTAELADQHSTDSAIHPNIHYTPSKQEEIASIGSETGNQRQTIALNTPHNQINAYSYNLAGKLLRQEQFTTVACNCTFSSRGPAYTAAYGQWDPLNKQFIDQTGDLVIKDRGCQTNGIDSQCIDSNDLCSRCCNDHHDPSSNQLDTNHIPYCDPEQGIFDRCFDPFRGISDFSLGKHLHYTANGTVANSGAYLESCRMKQIDGRWQVYQDWHRVALNAMPRTTFIEHRSDYKNYVISVLDTILDSSINQFNGQDNSEINWPPAPDLFSAPLQLALGNTQTLTAHGLYIDYLNPELLNALRQQKQHHQDYLSHLPVYDIELSHFVEDCQTPRGWCSSNPQQVTINANQIQALSITTEPTHISFGFARSNSGLAKFNQAIDVSLAANSDDIIDQALLAISVSAQIIPNSP